MVDRFDDPGMARWDVPNAEDKPSFAFDKSLGEETVNLQGVKIRIAKRVDIPLPTQTRYEFRVSVEQAGTYDFNWRRHAKPSHDWKLYVIQKADA
jgi:hypothetical protein